MPSLDDELDLLSAAAEAAGEVALRFHGRSPRMWHKANDSPVTEADIAVDQFLADWLLKARPDYGWLSEESEDRGTRLSAPRTFIVDPIDGTRDFIAGGNAWTIPIALVEEGRPVASVILAPGRGEMYRAIAGKGATLNGGRIRVSGRKQMPGARIAGSKRLFRPPFFEADGRVSIVFYASLAYRLARVAAGRLDAAAVKGSAHDWDVAAADLIVREAGGDVTDFSGSVLRYDRVETAHPPIVAATPALTEEIAGLLRAVAAAAAQETAGDTAGESAGGR